MKSLTRTFSLAAASALLSVGLLGAGISAAHAEMTDPPIQAEVDSSGGGFVASYGTVGGNSGSFSTIGSIPPGYGDGNWSAYAGGTRGEYFYYYPNNGREVNLNDVAYFNAYKGMGCSMIGSGVGVVCDR